MKQIHTQFNNGKIPLTPEIVAAIKDDFKNCLWFVWNHLGLPDPTPVQYDIADFLQSPVKRRMVEGFRGVGKSWITAAYVLWKLLNDPEEKIMVVSASKLRSDDFVSFTKRLISDMEIFHHLKAKDGQRDTMVAFDVAPARPAHSPSVKAVGINGQLTGSRATEIIADDVEVPNNSATEDMREKLAKACTEFEAILVPEGNTKITYLGTPQTEESYYNSLQERGYTIRVYPALYPDVNKIKNYKGCLCPKIYQALEKNQEELESGLVHDTINGTAVDPQRFDLEELMERKASYGMSGFMLQFMLDTSLSDAEKYPLKTSDAIAMHCHETIAPLTMSYANIEDNLLREMLNVGFNGDRWYKPFMVDKEWKDYEGSVMYVDPAGRGTDETGYAVVKQCHGFLYVTRFGGFAGGYDDDTLQKLAEIAREQSVNLILVESNFGDGMFNALFSPVLNRIYPHCALEEDKNHIQKERRIIDTLEPVLNRHKLIFDSGEVKRDLEGLSSGVDNARAMRYSLFYQLTHITKERGSLKHDDKLDALAGAVAYWVASMSRDELKAKDKYKEKKLDIALNEFINNAKHSGRKHKSKLKKKKIYSVMCTSK